MCLFPISANLDDCNKIKFTAEGSLKLPCGKCSECISKRSAEWATRARHEISLHQHNSFITLTYNEENLPSIFLVKTEFQKFIKRLRKHIKQPIRYMVSHEYGSQTFRPHHHAIIFGYNPDNQKYLKTTKSGEKIFTSTQMDKLWQHGFHSIGTANEKTAYYIASYSLKGKKHTLPDPNTGELVAVSDCMDVSKRPAIGYNFFINNQEQIYNSENVPRYYQKLSKEKNTILTTPNPTQSQLTRLQKLQQINPSLHEHFENEQMFKLKNRSPSEIYAKFTIDQQKINITTEFRETATNLSRENYANDKYLKQTRDENHLATKEKK